MSLSSALASGDLAELPSRRDEAWRWTDLRGLIRMLPPASPPGVWVPGGPLAEVASDELVIVNGRPQNFPGQIRVGVGDRPVTRLRFVSAPNAGSHRAKVEIIVARDAHLTLLESYEGTADGYVVAAELDIRLEAGARLDRLVLAEDAAEAISVSEADVVLAPGATLNQTVLTNGARRQRLETRVRHPGGGAAVRLDGLYRLGDRRHADITTAVLHDGPGGSTRQLIKGVAGDQARGVFQGLIRVAEGADGTDARMGHHALITSDKAEVDAKPELEIYADDVSCAHGNTIGALDEQALFYARQRGIPQAEARAMLTEAFLGEVIDRIDHENARDVARAWLSRTLRAG